MALNHRGREHAYLQSCGGPRERPSGAKSFSFRKLYSKYCRIFAKEFRAIMKSLGILLDVFFFKFCLLLGLLELYLTCYLAYRRALSRRLNNASRMPPTGPRGHITLGLQGLSYWASGH